jgi:hypothetical protein
MAARRSRRARNSLVVSLILLLLFGGCALRRRVHVFPRCADGLPPEILIDPACPPDGICGYSCLPGRWDLAVPSVPPARPGGS